MTLLDDLSRAPDVQAPNLVAVDATDRLLLDSAADLIAASGPGDEEDLPGYAVGVHLVDRSGLLGHGGQPTGG